MSTRLWEDTDKFRYFQFEMYEESAPENWEQIMKDSSFEFAVSPIHNQKDSTDDAEEIKPHRHVIFHTAGNSPWTVLRARTILCKLGLPANGYIEPCFHPRNAQRYLIHLDNPEKQQFESFSQIQIINNFPLDLTKDLSTEEKRIVRYKIFQLIRKYTITEYYALIDALYDGYGDFDMIDYACNHTILFNAYLTSYRNKMKEETEREKDE